MQEIKTYSNIPDWIKNLKSGDKVVVYFPRRKQISYSEVISNYIPKSSDYLAILSVTYKINQFDKFDELLYDNYLGEIDNEYSWNIYPII